ncbi:GntR family transcriptional regulator [Lysinimonas soli]|uniref:GntR family transcriptional regulator n=1 Tax=Lysinimonas soli TaxID=1074233 RepID=A0ABW0NLF9_9MICO
MQYRKLVEAPEASPSAAPQLSLTDQIYERARREIIEAKWRPGRILLEPELAAAYGVSKTPVREALRLLVQEDWVVNLPRRGYLVRPLRLDDIGEVFGLRSMIEPTLIAEIARMSGPSAAEILAARVSDQRGAEGDLHASLDAASSFHLAAAQLANNRRAEGMLERLLAEVRRLHYLMPNVEAHINSQAEITAHERILNAVRAGDADKAAGLMREHLNEVARTMVNGFAQVPTD